MSFKQTVKNNTNTNTICRASSLEPNPQLQSLNLIKVFLDSYLFRGFIEYTNLRDLTNTCRLLLKSKKYINYKLNKYRSLL